MYRFSALAQRWHWTPTQSPGVLYRRIMRIKGESRRRILEGID